MEIVGEHSDFFQTTSNKNYYSDTTMYRVLHCSCSCVCLQSNFIIDSCWVSSSDIVTWIVETKFNSRSNWITSDLLKHVVEKFWALSVWQPPPPIYYSYCCATAHSWVLAFFNFYLFLSTTLLSSSTSLLSTTGIPYSSTFFLIAHFIFSPSICLVVPSLSFYAVPSLLHDQHICSLSNSLLKLIGENK